MICHKCKTKYYSRTHCPKCGAEAFPLNRRQRRTPSTANYKSLYVFTVAAFLIVIFIAVVFLKYTEKMEQSAANTSRYQNVKLIEIEEEPAAAEEEEEVSPAPPAKKVRKSVTPRRNEITRINLRGIEAYNNAEFDRALGFFLQAHSIEKDNDTIKANLYNTYYALGNIDLSNKLYDKALTSFSDGLLYVDNDFSAYQGMGIAYYGLGKNKDALEKFLAAYNLNPNRDELKLTIARLYFNEEDYENTKKYLNLIDDKRKYLKEITMYSELASKGLKEVEDKVETQTAHFNVYYDGYGDPVAGNLVSIILEEVYYNVGSSLNYFPDEKITAILLTRKQFDENLNLPKWAGALFDGKIKLPAGGLKDRTAKLQKILAHEYTHAAAFSKTKGNCPTWLNEGLAQLLAEEEEVPDATITYILENNKLPSINVLHGNFLKMSNEDARIAYITSRLFTKSLVDKFSMNSINDYLGYLSDGSKSDVAFYKAFYTHITESFEQFKNELSLRYQ